LVTIQQIIDAVGELETEIARRPAGDPELVATIPRIAQLQWELQLIRGLQGPLVPDASSPPSLAEQSVAELDEALKDLKAAAAMKAGHATLIGEPVRPAR
jgi:hypothetical protein